MEAIFKPPVWECPQARANKIIKKIKAGEKVTRWEVFPLRYTLIKLAGNDYKLVEQLNLYINEAKASF